MEIKKIDFANAPTSYPKRNEKKNPLSCRFSIGPWFLVEKMLADNNLTARIVVIPIHSFNGSLRIEKKNNNKTTTSYCYLFIYYIATSNKMRIDRGGTQPQPRRTLSGIIFAFVRESWEIQNAHPLQFFFFKVYTHAVHGQRAKGTTHI